MSRRGTASGLRRRCRASGSRNFHADDRLQQRLTVAQLASVTAASLIEVLEQFAGHPIPNCPGRYVLRGLSETAGPEIVCPGAPVSQYDVKTARDTVVVSWFTEWGLISYSRADGTWRHTVNTSGGFRRKLTDLGIPFPG